MELTQNESFLLQLESKIYSHLNPKDHCFVHGICSIFMKFYIMVGHYVWRKMIEPNFWRKKTPACPRMDHFHLNFGPKSSYDLFSESSFRTFWKFFIMLGFYDLRKSYRAYFLKKTINDSKNMSLLPQVRLKSFFAVFLTWIFENFAYRYFLIFRKLWQSPIFVKNFLLGWVILPQFWLNSYYALFLELAQRVFFWRFTGKYET